MAKSGMALKAKHTGPKGEIRESLWVFGLLLVGLNASV